MSVPVPEAIGGLLLLFALPGYATTRALFPEWRIRGEVALLRAVEVGTLSLVLSVTYTILVGYVLGVLPGALFQASWSDPLLETALAAITVVGFAAAGVRGSFRKIPPSAPHIEPDSGDEGAWDLLRELDGLTREERRLRHALRLEPPRTPQHAQLEGELAEVRRQAEELRRRREADYAA